MATPMLMSEALSVSLLQRLCDRYRVQSYLSGHQQLHTRLLSSLQASRAPSAKGRNGVGIDKGFMVLLTHSHLILYLKMGC